MQSFRGLPGGFGGLQLVILIDLRNLGVIHVMFENEVQCTHSGSCYSVSGSHICINRSAITVIIFYVLRSEVLVKLDKRGCTDHVCLDTHEVGTSTIQSSLKILGNASCTRTVVCRLVWNKVNLTCRTWYTVVTEL